MSGRVKEDSCKPVFVARGLSKTYRVGEIEIPALRSIDLEIYEGEFIVLLGPSGSGKSTLLNILGGLDAPTGREALWRDHNLVAADESELTRYRREHIGFVFQFYNLIASLTARDNVALVTEMAENPMRPEEALTLVGLGHRLNHFPSQLSGGEQQRVAIARAIAKRPDVLLCDEPTGALDYPTGKIVLEALARANQQLATTVAVISHNAAIGGMADRVMCLADCRIARIEVNAKIVRGGRPLRSGMKPGDFLAVEILEGQRPRRNLTVTGLVNDLVGLSAYMKRRKIGQPQRFSASRPH